MSRTAEALGFLPDIARRRRILIPAAVALVYIALTWALYLNWMARMEAFIAANPAALTDPRFFELVPQMPGLLIGLMIPIPRVVSAFTGGDIAFWAVALQGCLIGLAVYAVMAWRRRSSH